MLLVRLIAIGMVTAFVGCTKTPAAVSSSHVVNLWMNGARQGEEHATTTIEGQRITTEMRTMFTGPPAMQLEARLIVERGRASSLRVTGVAPPAFPLLVDVAVTPDRTDVFPVKAPLPVHVLSALVRQGVVSARRRFQALPEGTVTIDACQGPEGPFADALCHAVTGLPAGPALVWIDERQQLAGAVVRTPFGPIVASTPDREGAHAALLRRFDVYSAP